MVYVMEKCDDGWFVGTSQRYRNDNGSFAFFCNLIFLTRSGIFGTFPGNYVVKA